MHSSISTAIRQIYHKIQQLFRQVFHLIKVLFNMFSIRVPARRDLKPLFLNNRFACDLWSKGSVNSVIRSKYKQVCREVGEKKLYLYMYLQKQVPVVVLYFQGILELVSKLVLTHERART